MVLNEIEILGKATIMNVSTSLDRDYTGIAMAMIRYHRMGLLSRSGVHRKNKIYALTERGTERLEWFRAQERDTIDEVRLS